MTTTGDTNNSGYGQFGALAKQYAEGRKGVPDEVLDCMWSALGNRQRPRILDLGCGTGIPSRQLAQRGAVVTAVDSDAHMIQTALEQPARGVSYIVAHASDVPFASREFDAVTAFSALHWFSDRDSLDEIRRVLKPAGILFVVNKNEEGDFKREYRKILEAYTGTRTPDVKAKYDPADLLQRHGYRNVSQLAFRATETFTLHQAIAYLQSVSLWNLVPHKARSAARRDVELFCRDRSQKGIVTRRLSITAVWGSC